MPHFTNHKRLHRKLNIKSRKPELLLLRSWLAEATGTSWASWSRNELCKVAHTYCQHALLQVSRHFPTYAAFNVSVTHPLVLAEHCEWNREISAPQQQVALEWAGWLHCSGTSQLDTTVYSLYWSEHLTDYYCVINHLHVIMLLLACLFIKELNQESTVRERVAMFLGKLWVSIKLRRKYSGSHTHPLPPQEYLTC